MNGLFCAICSFLGSFTLLSLLFDFLEGQSYLINFYKHVLRASYGLVSLLL